MTLATSPGYLRYPPPTVYLADVHSSDRSSLADELPLMSLPFFIWPSFARDDGRISLQHTDGVPGSSIAQQRVDHSTSVRLLTYSTPSGQYELLLSPMEPSSSPMPEEPVTNSLTEMENSVPQPPMDSMDTTEVQPEERSNQFFPFGDSSYWELPFLQGWLVGQSQAGQRAIRPVNGSGHENPSSFGETETPSLMASSVMPTSISQSRVTGRSSSRHRSSRSRAATGSGEGAFVNIGQDESGLQPVVSRIQTELATSLAAAATAELPCTVKLRIWPHDIKDPCASLDAARCRLTIPHAVLCRYIL